MRSSTVRTEFLRTTAGIYEGPGQVQMGGTWQVTVLATKSGQTIAQKQLSVNTEGGVK